MKNLVTILSLMTISWTASASTLSKCQEQVLNIAQINLDLRAKSYTHVENLTSGTIKMDSLKQISDDGKSLKADMYANIITGVYHITVTVDTDWCGIESVKIDDLGER